MADEAGSGQPQQPTGWHGYPKTDPRLIEWAMRTLGTPEDLATQVPGVAGTMRAGDPALRQLAQILGAATTREGPALVNAGVQGAVGGLKPFGRFWATSQNPDYGDILRRAGTEITLRGRTGNPLHHVESSGGTMPNRLAGSMPDMQRLLGRVEQANPGQELVNWLKQMGLLQR